MEHAHGRKNVSTANITLCKNQVIPVPSQIMTDTVRHFLFASLVALSAVSVCCADDAAIPSQFGGATPLQWSARMADSEMSRLGDRLAWKPGGTAKWDYSAGLFTLSLLKLNKAKPDALYVPFVTNAIGSFISSDGKIQTYKPEEFQLDSLNSGKTALALFQITKDARYKKAADILRAQLDTQPRTFNGGFWHKQRYTNQMWLDGIYMAEPFYSEYTKLFGGATNFDDVAKQFHLIDEHLFDLKTGLFYHGWDAAKIQPWANPATGASSNFWGRADGWYAMALVDTLDFFPTNHPIQPLLVATLKFFSHRIVKWQDADSGLWWQVMDQGNRKGNYLEATASAMFVYALAKGVNDGELSRDYVPAILKGYNGILTKLIKVDGERISLTQCCSVAGLGSASPNGRVRDGSFDYYVSEPIVENDMKGVGPFILAGIEVQKILHSQNQSKLKP
jgi:unsaturated rhamnogalacturonyl hydrolase